MENDQIEMDQTRDNLTVEIHDFSYNPPELTITAGMDVIFTNHDDEVHSVTSKNDGFDLELDPGESMAVRFDTTGEYDYYCRYHPTMEGMVVVEEA